MEREELKLRDKVCFLINGVDGRAADGTALCGANVVSLKENMAAIAAVAMLGVVWKGGVGLMDKKSRGLGASIFFLFVFFLTYIYM